MKIGLKLWSNNTDFYFDEAKRLYTQGHFDYIELYVVPKTPETLSKWKTMNIPFTLHAPHFVNGVNLAKKEFEASNIEIFNEVKRFSEGLNAKYIVVHSGINGDIKETIRQLKNINMTNILIENKPFIAPINDKLLCRGATIEEIELVIKEVGCGFCLDVGHAICSANSLNIDPYEHINDFNKLNPTCYHLSDNFIGSQYDKHLHFGEGNYDFKKIFDMINLNKNIAIETQKNSKENLDDFIKDVIWLKNLS